MAFKKPVTCPVCKEVRLLYLKVGHKLRMKCRACKGKQSPERLAQCVRYQQERRRADPEYRERQAHLHVEHRRCLRREVIAAYGNACSCCGQSQYEFLCLDHIQGGGDKERKTKSQVFAWYRARKALKAGKSLPKDYRVLCHNCNMARSFYGYCPHEPADKEWVGKRHDDVLLRERDVMDKEEGRRR